MRAPDGKTVAIVAGGVVGLWLLYQVLRPKGAKVYNRQRAAGVHPKLQAFLDWWEVHGTFPISVVADGGVRTDEALQADLFRRGVTKAATLRDTPHGRGAALDVAPYDVKLRAPYFQAADKEFAAIGAAARALGLTWGGDWQSFKDKPHVELSAWRSLPFPPRY